MKTIPLAFVLIFATSCIITRTPQIQKINHSQTEDSLKFEYIFSDTIGNEYLRALRHDYQLQEKVKDAHGEIDKTLIIMNWVNHLWKHNGSNQPENNDALSILKEVEEGKEFRCVEYGIVTSECLNALGIQARLIGLKTSEVETAKIGAGHVALEFYSKDDAKWVFADPQFNVIPHLDGRPLNSVEFQRAIMNNSDSIELITKNTDMNDNEKKKYLNWVGPYLFYLDVSFDNQKGVEGEKIKYAGKSRLMLVPLGAKNPEIFQIEYPINNCYYTNSVELFYQKPKGF